MLILDNFILEVVVLFFFVRGDVSDISYLLLGSVVDIKVYVVVFKEDL